MTKVIIVENESNSLAYLVQLLSKYPEIEIVDTAATVEQGAYIINKWNPNLIFLDIELDDGTAFDLLEKVKNRTFELIFTTAFDTYYARAFQHFAFNYLLKPIGVNELDNVLLQYRKMYPKFSFHKLHDFKGFMQPENSKILLNTGDGHLLVSLDEILYCKANQNFTIFKLTTGATEVISNSLKYYTELFQDKGFFRANRSFLVNLSNVKKIIKREGLKMTNNEVIRVSMKNRAALDMVIKKTS